MVAVETQGSRWTVHQLHLDPGGGTLDDVVEELGEIVLRALGPGVEGPPARLRPAIRDAVRRGLQRYVVAFDVCGLAGVCHESTRFDPWGESAGEPEPASRGGGDGR